MKFDQPDPKGNTSLDIYNCMLIKFRAGETRWDYFSCPARRLLSGPMVGCRFFGPILTLSIAKSMSISSMVPMLSNLTITTNKIELNWAHEKKGKSVAS